MTKVSEKTKQERKRNIPNKKEINVPVNVTDQSNQEIIESELSEGVIKLSELFQQKIQKDSEKNQEILNVSAELGLTQANLTRLTNQVLNLQDQYNKYNQELKQEIFEEYGEYQLTDVPGYIKLITKQ